MQQAPFEPREFQKRAVRLMLEQSSLGLFLDPGMGKTATWLAAFTLLKNLKMVRSMLVIAPLRPMYTTWPGEIEKYPDFRHLTWTFLHGPNKQARLQVEADIYLINPEGVPWLCSQIDPTELADVLCVDESTKFKNWSSQRVKRLRAYSSKFNRRWIGTGTPAPRGMMDLFSQMFLLDGGHALGRTITQFRKRYFFTEPWNPYHYHLQEGADREIIEKLSPLILQLSAKDYLDLPEISVTDIQVTLPSTTREVYEKLEKEFIATLEDGQILLAPQVALAALACRQICGGAIYTEHPAWKELDTSKMDALHELLEDIGPHPTVIVYEFAHERERMLARSPDWEDLTGQSPEDAHDLISRWNRGQVPRMMIHSASAHGINLQHGGRHMVWYSLTWSWEAYKQMIDRLPRQGQQGSVVMVYRLLAKDTIDNTVAARLEERRMEEQHIRGAIGEYRD